MELADKRRAVFLDRDGTLIVERDYLSDPDGVVLLPGVIEGLHRLTDFVLVVVSNQSGVGRGYFGCDDVERVNARLDTMLRAENIVIAGWYYCPHAPEAGCRCRKPAPGLIEDACHDLHLDAATSFVVGDKAADLDLARAVGARGYLVTTGYGRAARAYAQEIGCPVCDSVLDAADRIAAEVLASAGSSNELGPRP